MTVTLVNNSGGEFYVSNDMNPFRSHLWGSYEFQFREVGAAEYQSAQQFHSHRWIEWETRPLPETIHEERLVLLGNGDFVGTKLTRRWQDIVSSSTEKNVSTGKYEVRIKYIADSAPPTQNWPAPLLRQELISNTLQFEIR